MTAKKTTQKEGAAKELPAVSRTNDIAATGYRLPQAMFDAQHPADTVEDPAPPLKAVVTPSENKSRTPATDDK